MNFGIFPKLVGTPVGTKSNIAVFNLPEQPNTYVEINLDEEWVLGKPAFSKAAWSPFEGFKVQTDA